MNELRNKYRLDKKRIKREYKANKRRLKNDYIAAMRKRAENSAAIDGGTGGSVGTGGSGGSAAFAVANSNVKLSGFAPKRTVLEEIGNAVSHGIGSVFAICALIAMLCASVTLSQKIAAWVYGIGMFVMFTMSCLYHSFGYGTGVKRLFRRFDYLSIYLLIGATFAPLLLCYAPQTFGQVFFIVQWLIIATGITLVAVFGPARLRKIHIPLYIILGWSGLILIPTMIIRGDFVLLWWILGGGLLYTVGMIPFAVDKRVAHFIWHLFVLFGAVVQWIGIYAVIYGGL